MENQDFEGRLALGHRLADAARTAILPYFRSGRLGTENKSSDGFDPVTRADRAAEQAMRAILTAEVPDDGILGEEFGETPSNSGLMWVLDPIDGTRGFVSGTPTWGVLIALSNSDGPVFGFIDQPYTDERFVGFAGKATLTHGGKTSDISVSQTQTLENAILFSTYPEVGTPEERTAFDAVSDCVQLTRFGTDCYAYALLAAGQIDLVIEAGLNSYDIAGPIGLIQNAGGIVTDWHGNPVHDGGRAIAASTPEIHRAAMAILQEKFTGPK